MLMGTQSIGKRKQKKVFQLIKKKCSICGETTGNFFELSKTSEVYCGDCVWIIINNKRELKLKWSDLHMNMSAFAKTITLKEGKKINLSIAQVCEVIKLTLQELAKEEPEELLKLLKRYKLK